MSLSTGVSVLCGQIDTACPGSSSEALIHSCLSRVPHYCVWIGLHHCQALDERNAGEKRYILFTVACFSAFTYRQCVLCCLLLDIPPEL